MTCFLHMISGHLNIELVSEGASLVGDILLLDDSCVGVGVSLRLDALFVSHFNLAL